MNDLKYRYCRIVFFLALFLLCVTARAVEPYGPVVVNMGSRAQSQINPDIAAVDDKLYVVWQSNESTEWQVHFAVGEYFGGKSAPDICLSCDSAPGIHREPVIAVDPNSGRIYVAWQGIIDDKDYDIFITVSVDDGKTFSKPARVNMHKGGNQLFPAITVAPDHGTVHVAWQDNRAEPGAYHIFTARSIDGGQTFSPGLLISDQDGLNLWASVAAGQGGRVVVAWQCGDNSCVSHSADGGQTFSDSRPAIPDQGKREFPDIALADDGTVWLAFARRGNNHELDVYAARATWSDDLEFDTPVAAHAETKGVQTAPVVIARNGNISVAWTDGRTISDYDIYLSEFNKQAEPVFENIEQRIDPFPSGSSENPALATSERNGKSMLYIVWMDDQSGDYDIYLMVLD